MIKYRQELDIFKAVYPDDNFDFSISKKEPAKTVAELKRDIGLRKRELSTREKKAVLKRLGHYNRIHKTSHSIKFEPVGQADLFTHRITFNPQERLFQLKNKSKKGPNEELNERLTSMLSELGVKVETLDSLMERTGYDAVSVADILDKIILIAKGKADITTLPEEFSHFFIEALGDNHPLVKGMLKAIDEKYKEILGEDYKSYFVIYGGDVIKLKKEAAGKVLGEQIIREFEQKDYLPIVKWLQRIVDKVLSWFRSVKENAYRKEVKRYYGEATTNILAGRVTSDMKETLGESKAGRYFNLGEDDLDIMQKTLKDAITAVYKKMRIYKGKGVNDFSGTQQRLYKALLRKAETNASTLGVIQFLQSINKDLAQIEKNIQEIKDELSGDELTTSKNELVKQLREMYQYATAYQPILEHLVRELRSEVQPAADIVDKVDPFDILKLDLLRNRDMSGLKGIDAGIFKAAHKSLGAIDYIQSQYYTLGVPLFADFLKPFAGPNYNIKELEQSLRYASRDITFFERWLDSMAESSDDVLKLVDQSVALTKEGARLKAIEDQKILKIALKALEDDGIKDMEWIYERFEDGSLTGNLLTEVNWGEYKQDRSTFFEGLEERYGLLASSVSGRSINLDDMNEAQTIFWYKEAKHLPKIQQLERHLTATNSFPDEKTMIMVLAAVTSNSYKKEVSIWMTEHTEPHANLKAIMANMRQQLTPKEYQEWYQQNTAGREDSPIYTGMLSQPKTSIYGNAAFAQLNDAQKDFHTIIMDMKASLDALLPVKFQREVQAPQVRKDFIERLTSTKSFKELSELKKEISETFQVKEDEAGRGSRLEEHIITDEKGQPISFLPILYIREVKDKKSLSTDIVATMSLYSAMVHDHHDMNRIIDVLEMGRDIVAHRKIAPDAVKAGSKVAEVINSVSETVQSAVTKRQADGNKAYERMTDYYDMIIYGKLRKDEKEFTLFGLTFDKAKTIDFLGRYVALQALAFNIFAGLQNPILGNILTRQEAITGEHFNNKNLLWADKTYALDLPSLLGEVGKRDQTNKLALWLEKADTMQEFQADLHSIDTQRKNRFSKLFNSSAFFVVNHIGEHQMQTRTSLAIADTIILTDKEGNEMNLYEAHHVEGNRLVLKPELRMKDGTIFTKQDFLVFVRKQNFLNQRLHGIYNERDRAAIQKYALGRLAVMFRKWMKPGFNRRFQSKRFNFGGQVYTEGMYTTTGHFITQLISDLQKGQFLYKAHWKALDEHQKKNMWRSLSEVSYLIAAFTLAHVLTDLAGDDDEDWVLNMAAYQANRFVTEIAIYIPILGTGEILKIVKSPAAAVNTVADMTKFLQFWNALDVYERGYFKGHTKLYKRGTKLIPIYHQIEGLMHPEDKLIYFAQ